MSHCSCSSVEIQFSTFPMKNSPMEPSHHTRVPVGVRRWRYRGSAVTLFSCKHTLIVERFRSIKENWICFGFDTWNDKQVNYCSRSPGPLTLIIRTICALFSAIFFSLSLCLSVYLPLCQPVSFSSSPYSLNLQLRQLACC